MSDVIIDGVGVTYEEAHKMLWYWLAEDEKREKKDFFKIHECSEIPISKCFCCQQAIIKPTMYIDCALCPINWGSNDNGDDKCFCMRELFGKWDRSYNNEERKKLAKQIAELPWKDGGWNE